VRANVKLFLSELVAARQELGQTCFEMNDSHSYSEDPQSVSKSIPRGNGVVRAGTRHDGPGGVGGWCTTCCRPCRPDGIPNSSSWLGSGLGAGVETRRTTAVFDDGFSFPTDGRGRFDMDSLGEAFRFPTAPSGLGLDAGVGTCPATSSR
jgi:hypothetical protein